MYLRLFISICYVFCSLWSKDNLFGEHTGAFNNKQLVQIWVWDPASSWHMVLWKSHAHIINLFVFLKVSLDLSFSLKLLTKRSCFSQAPCVVPSCALLFWFLKVYLKDESLFSNFFSNLCFVQSSSQWWVNQLMHKQFHKTFHVFKVRIVVVVNKCLWWQQVILKLTAKKVSSHVAANML